MKAQLKEFLTGASIDSNRNDELERNIVQRGPQPNTNSNAFRAFTGRGVVIGST
jgi:hypothetical protein